MNIVRIGRILHKEFNRFLQHIDDPNTKELVKQNTIITGGCIASMLLNEDVNDYDLYFTNRETVHAVVRFFLTKFIRHNNMNLSPDSFIDEEDDRIKIQIGNDGILRGRPDRRRKYHPIAITPNSITLSDNVQLIIRFYGDIEEVHRTFDFAHVQNYWLSETSKVYLKPNALESLLTKELIYKGSEYPLCSIIRTRKFLKRGFNINAGQYLKMAMQLNELDLSNPLILQDQLVGVDVAYFSKLIGRVKDLEAHGEEIDASIITELVDEIFNEMNPDDVDMDDDYDDRLGLNENT